MIKSVFNMASITFNLMYSEKSLVTAHGCVSRALLVGAVAVLTVLGSGCSKSTAPGMADEEQRLPLADPDRQEPTPVPTAIPMALLDLKAITTLDWPAPEITSIEILAASGLQVAYTQEAQKTVIPALIMETNWLHMQSCLSQVGVAPLVLIRPSTVSPLTTTDDVIFTIGGIPAASVSAGSTPVIQVRLPDFQAIGDASGYYLRSAMGRLLWTSAGLAARDYPFNCAQRLSDTE